MGKRSLKSLSWLLAPVALSVGLLCADCGVKDLVDKVADAGLTVSVDVKAVLRVLFPDLTEAEIAEYSVNLDAAAVLALKSELESIRKAVATFSADLFASATEKAATRQTDLQSVNGGFPLTLAPIATGAFFDRTKGEAWIDLSGTFSGTSAVQLAAGDVSVTVGGAAQTVQLECLGGGTPVDVVFLVDITGSMTNVIHAVRDSVSRFVSAIVASNVTGTIGVVTFQDTVGVNVSFQERNPGIERSPFFAPVPINDATRIALLQRFIARLEANEGDDAPENVGAAIDFARNNVIGYTRLGQPNVIGDGVEDPPRTKPWPALTSARQVFVVLTDSTFHSDSRTATNSSLLAPFKPRRISDITASLRATRTVVHTSDPSWIDVTTTPTGAANEVEVDNDYWAIQTGGVGEDTILGYSLVDLELLVVASNTGLLDISLQSILASTCRARFSLPSFVGGAFSLEIKHGTETFTKDLVAVAF